MSVAFSLWITGRPGAGKSTLVRALVLRLRKRGIDPVVLTAEFFRDRFSPRPAGSEVERSTFYRGLVDVARMFAQRGIPVLIDATGMRRSYRAAAREQLEGFAEIHVDCPPEIAGARRAETLREGGGGARPVAVAERAVEYEAPVHPEVVVHSDREDPETGADRTMDFLISSGLIPSRRAYRI